ncbi:MAG TPA: DsrE family protein [Verrucomicrobiae bacterium]|nr:DsrE family protein [Verrucomicrobiae bacterium]
MPVKQNEEYLYDMVSAGKKLALLVAAAPEATGFLAALRLAEEARTAGVEVYLYCIDEAVAGIGEAPLQRLVGRGLKLFGCAFSMQQRGRPLSGEATFGGLALLSQLTAAADRFLAFT